jgi:hypothetical protein
MESHIDAVKVYLFWKLRNAKNVDGGYPKKAIPDFFILSGREQHVIRLKSCADHEKPGPKNHIPKQKTVFDI